MPYRKHDKPTTGNPRGYMYSDSFPISKGASGLQYISTMQHADGVTLQALVQQLGYFNPDGYNIVHVDGGFANFAGTKDASGPQAFYGVGCQTYNSWLLFPLGMTPGQINNSTASLQIVRAPQTCNASTIFVPSFSPSHYVGPLTYSRPGISPIDSVVTYHYTNATPLEAGQTVGGNYEVTYWTDIYGLTRWETWGRVVDGGQPNTTCNGGTYVTDGWGTQWVRTDCRDWTYLSFTDGSNETVAFNPNSVMLDSPFQSDNQLLNSDFTTGIANWSRYSGDLQINWQRILNPNNNRWSLSFSCLNACSGDVLFQNRTLVNTAGKTKISYGGQMWVTSGTGGGHFQLFQFNASGALITSDTNVVTLNTNQEKQYTKEVTLNSNTKSVIWAFYPYNNTKQYHVVNPWVSLR